MSRTSVRGLATGIDTPLRSTSLGVAGRLLVCDPAGAAHQVDDHLVRDPHHDVLADILVVDLGCGVVGEHGEAELDAGHVFRGVLDEEVDVLREAARSVGDHGEPADQEVAGSGLVQRPTDTDDVVGLRRS